MILVIWIVFLGTVISSPEFSSKLCFRHKNYQSVICENESKNLSCHEHQLIRIKDIQIKNKTTGNVNDCVGCPAFDSYHELENVTDIVYFKTLLYMACSRKNKCNFTTEDILESFETDEYIWTAMIMYECVEEGVVKYVHSDSSRLCFTYEMGIGVLCRNMSVEISCMKNELIMIKDIQFARKLGSPSCNLCTSDGESFPWHTNSVISLVKSWLYYSCSKKNSCDFESVLATPTLDDKPFILAANITYRCVKEDLFKDICSSWIQETDYVHISLNETRSISSCTCMIVGDSLNTKIVVADYRPYKDLFECADSSLFIDGIEMFQCIGNGKDYSVYNKKIEVVNSEINITITFAASSPQMLWIYMEGNNVTFECNFDEEFSSNLPSSLSTSDSTSTKMTTILPETVTVSKKTTSQVSNTIKNTPQLLKEGSADKIFTLPVIAGGSAGIVAVVVIIAFIVCILCRRKSNIATKNDDNENIYTECNDKSHTENTQTIRNGVINKSYETENEIVEIKMNISSSYEEIWAMKERDDDADDNTEYVEPADILTENISENETNIQMSTTAQNKIEELNFMEPYFKTIDQKSQNKYAKAMKLNPKKDAYDTCSGIDNYSHIQVGKTKQTPKPVDNYSHIQMTENKHETSSFGNYSLTKLRQKDDIKPEEISDKYNRIDIDAKYQKDSVDTENSTTDVDENVEEEYDHLVNIYHH